MGVAEFDGIVLERVLRLLSHIQSNLNALNKLEQAKRLD